MRTDDEKRNEQAWCASFLAVYQELTAKRHRTPAGVTVFREVDVAEWLGCDQREIEELIASHQRELEAIDPFFVNENRERCLNISQVNWLCFWSGTPQALRVLNVVGAQVGMNVSEDVHKSLRHQLGFSEAEFERESLECLPEPSDLRIQ